MNSNEAEIVVKSKKLKPHKNEYLITPQENYLTQINATMVSELYNCI